ncbi:uncharacterized protein N7482_008405 [Penicillium canariense]|uniref:Uncharacterized protein n=1 Tax=Penicillium canariense TaxID=189055 RepID=A0A9W9HW78_9EURO|nr:uncharacterized protein N7482_008405 [Penicillium canariense]KAJ5157305.1 hypothetical protein N7482_008405 [Penicillium canariense]
MDSTGSTGTLTRPGELWQQSATKWQQSTMDAWHRSTAVWHDSKDRCHQSTMEVWHRSADSWNQSKTICRQSTAGLLARSANRIYQSTDRFQQLAALEPQTEQRRPTVQVAQASAPSITTAIQFAEVPQATQPPELAPSPEAPKLSQWEKSTQSPQSQYSPISSVSSPSASPQSPSETGTDSTASSPLSIDLSIRKRRPDGQIRGLLGFTDHVSTQVKEAKRLRDSKSTHLGEIERNWVNSTIADADDSAQELADLLELCRSDMAKRKGRGKISSANRKRWKLRDYRLAEERQSRLIRHQCRLDRVLNHLQNLKIPHEVLIPEHIKESAAELSVTEPTARSAVELPNDTTLESPPAMAELPSSQAIITRKPVPVLAELPGESTIIRIKPAKDIPKVIVTNTPDGSSFTLIGSPDTPHSTYESKEMNELLSWKQTRNDIRLQQSESLSQIISKMENNRLK